MLTPDIRDLIITQIQIYQLASMRLQKLTYEPCANIPDRVGCQIQRMNMSIVPETVEYGPSPIDAQCTPPQTQELKLLVVHDQFMQGFLRFLVRHFDPVHCQLLKVVGSLDVGEKHGNVLF